MYGSTINSGRQGFKIYTISINILWVQLFWVLNVVKIRFYFKSCEWLAKKIKIKKRLTLNNFILTVGWNTSPKTDSYSSQKQCETSFLKDKNKTINKYSFMTKKKIRKKSGPKWMRDSNFSKIVGTFFPLTWFKQHFYFGFLKICQSVLSANSLALAERHVMS